MDAAKQNLYQLRDKKEHAKIKTKAAEKFKKHAAGDGVWRKDRISER